MTTAMANWSCAGVCKEVLWEQHNLTICCVASCKYQVS